MVKVSGWTDGGWKQATATSVWMGECDLLGALIGHDDWKSTIEYKNQSICFTYVTFLCCCFSPCQHCDVQMGDGPIPQMWLLVKIGALKTQKPIFYHHVQRKPLQGSGVQCEGACDWRCAWLLSLHLIFFTILHFLFLHYLNVMKQFLILHLLSKYIYILKLLQDVSHLRRSWWVGSLFQSQLVFTSWSTRKYWGKSVMRSRLCREKCHSCV